MSSHLRIRYLTAEDLTFANSLSDIAGWNQLAVDWQRLIQYGRDGCFLGTWDGEPAATITTTNYADRVAWIGMVLVHPGFRRRGIATAIMKHALEYLQSKGVRCVKLDATSEGQRVYQQLGFRAEWSIDRWLREGENREVMAKPTTFDAGDLDIQAFGCVRQGWVGLLAERSRVCLHHRGSELDGYGLLRSGKRAAYLGPVVARCDDTARAITTQVLSEHNGCVLWDIPEVNQAAVQLAEHLGFRRTRHLVRMWTGDESVAGNPEMQFAIGDFATG